MPRPKPLVALHGAVNFERLVPFDSKAGSLPLANNDILVMRRAAGGDNLTLSISDINATGSVNIAQLIGGVNDDMLYRVGGVWTGTGPSGLSYNGATMELSGSNKIELIDTAKLEITGTGNVEISGGGDLQVTNGGNITLDAGNMEISGGGGIEMVDDGEISMEGGGIFLSDDAELQITDGPGITLEEGAGILIVDDGDIVISEGVITTELDGDDGFDLSLLAADSGSAATGDGGNVNIEGGDSVATTGDGGEVVIKSGAGFFQGAGGDILIEVGEGGAAGPGTSGNFFLNTLTGADAAAGLQVPIPGLVSIYGIGRSGSGPAGNLELWGGYASGAGGGSIGGDAIMWGGGQGGGAGEGGNAMLIGGESDTQPGDARVIGGQATVGPNGPGGQAVVTGGEGFGAGNSPGGTAGLIGGEGVGTGGGGPTFVRGGEGAPGSPATGGDVFVIGGRSFSTNADGGNVTIEGGTPAGSGDGGEILFRRAGLTQFRINEADDFHAEIGGGPAILNVDASGSVPVFIPNRADPGTGYTRSGLDQLSHVGNNIETLRVRASTAFVAANSNLLVWDYDNAGLTFLQFGADDSAGVGFKTVRVIN